METLYAIKGNRNRIETHFSEDGAQTSVTLMDSTSSATTVLWPETKTYTTMNWVEMAEEMASEAGEDSSIVFPKVTSTGNTETIAGFACRHWLIDDKTDVCMAQGLGNFGGGGSENLFNLYSAEIKSGKEIQ